MLTVSVSPEAGGLVRVNGDAPAGFPADYRLPDDSLVELEAVPFSEFSFVEWTGDMNTDESAVSLTLTCDQTVTAVFAATPVEGGEDGGDIPFEGGETDAGGDGDDGGGCFVQSVLKRWQ